LHLKKISDREARFCARAIELLMAGSLDEGAVGAWSCLLLRSARLCASTQATTRSKRIQPLSARGHFLKRSDRAHRVWSLPWVPAALFRSTLQSIFPARPFAAAQSK